MDNDWFNVIFSLAPTVLVGLVFWFVMRSIIHADRNERKARNKVEAEENAARDRLKGEPTDG